MELKEGLNPAVALKGDEAPAGYHVAPRIENSTQFGGPTMQAAAALSATGAPPPATVASVAAPPVSAGMSGPGTGSEAKKRRGRPRKYGPDGTVAMALSPMPISSSIPLTGEYSAWKRGRGKPVDTIKKSYKYEFESSGNRIAYFVGASFTPHVLTVNAGEDVTMKIMSFSQQGSRAICILCANGTISNVTLRQPTSSGGTLTYEGRFEILSLSGSFMPTENGGTKGRSGGMSVSLAGPDGRVLGGGLAGLLIAAGPVQVVVGSFLPGHQLEQKHKKQRTESIPVVTPAIVNTIAAEETKASYGGVKPFLTSTLSFHGDGSASLNPIQGIRPSAVDNKSSSLDDDSRDHSLSQCEVSS
ncbi:hypothetical protein SLEP1_g42178 [Rubroshorea leprosula]|uniref:AT-hook motif nuclear-localized protein n=1 Tax=Rubroshorea leprosula TaxID=152421 RepID=A0AAV5L8Z0_9ROSI|nr:hypothetical protein SLEP1_g42178 [Rubroshorea leprosula]